MEALASLRQQAQSGKKIQVAVLLPSEYELLCIYGPYEVLIACSKQLEVITIGLTDHQVPSPGAPICETDHVLADNENDDDDIPSVDVLVVPAQVLSESSAINPNLLELCRTVPLILVTGSSNTEKLRQVLLQQPQDTLFSHNDNNNNNNNNTKVSLLCSPSGIDLACYFVEQVLGETARKFAESVVEYHGQDPFFGTTTPSFVDSSTGVAGTKIFAVEDTHKNNNNWTQTVGTLLFDGFELLDCFGPLAVLQAANQMAGRELYRFEFYSETERVKSSRGPIFRVANRLVQDFTSTKAINDTITSIDILLIPGGIGSIAEIHNTAAKDWTARVCDQQAKSVLTVCTGSGFLASTGRLNGLEATTNKLSWDLVTSWGRQTRWKPRDRWVRSGKYWTSSGVAAGTDQCLAFVAEAHGEELADRIAQDLAWNRSKISTCDPFVATRVGWMQTTILNTLISIVFRWLPHCIRPRATTIEKYT